MFEQNEWNFRRIEEEIKCRFWSCCVAKGEADSSVSFVVWNRTKQGNLYDSVISFLQVLLVPFCEK